MTRRQRRQSRLPVPPRRRPEQPSEDSDLGGVASARPDVTHGASRDSGGTAAEEAGAWRALLGEKLRLLPKQSGVYLLRDARGRVLYVGKAKRLSGRVPSYFRGPLTPDARMRGLRRRIRSLDWVVTSTEAEALVLEDALIKQYAPAFNIRLKDDKRYPYIKVTSGHPFPAMVLTRHVAADGSRYYGPFTRVRDLREILKTLRTIFRLRNCSDRRLAQGGRECLQYFIGRCSAPCTRRVDEAAYAEQVRPLLDVLSGRGEEAVRLLRGRMLASAEALRFEESARLRDDIEVLQALLHERGMAAPAEAASDVVALTARGNLACGVFLHVREGRVLGKSHRLLTGIRGTEPGEQMRALLLAAYVHAPRVPLRVICSPPPAGMSDVRDALVSTCGHPVDVRAAPRSGPLAHLARLAEENGHLILEEEELRGSQRRGRLDRSVYALQEALGLPVPPCRIEGFDISNIQAAHAVASMVSFRDGKPWKAGYRRFRMSPAQVPDDFARMAEVVRRRFLRLRDESGTPPDLVLIDGGPGQVGAALASLREAGFEGIPLVGLAKREEEIIVPGGAAPLRLPRSSEALRLLQRVRDEAHRFAVSYHRALRGKAQGRSRLDAIPGIGPARRRVLLRHFGSLEAIRGATLEQIEAVPGIGPGVAAALHEALQSTLDPGRSPGEGRGKDETDPLAGGTNGPPDRPSEGRLDIR